MLDSLARSLHLIIFFAVAMVGARRFGTTGEVDELTAVVVFAGGIATTIEFCHLEVRRWRVSLLYLLSAVTYAIVTWRATLAVIQLSR